MARRILVLGGTTEARRLADRLSGRLDLDVIVSLAGRTRDMVEHSVPVRIGGFGGAEGLAAYLLDWQIDALIDATHPFADRMSRNAVRAANDTGVALLSLRRAPWTRMPGDRWLPVADVEDAVRALGAAPRRVFLALGRQEIDAFAAAPQHFYLVRSVDPVDPPLPVPDAAYVVARGPFSEIADRALLEAHRIDVVVSRNSGGEAAYGKIAAARALAIDVVMIARPPLPETASVGTIEEVLAWLDHVSGAPKRGV